MPSAVSSPKVTQHARYKVFAEVSPQTGLQKLLVKEAHANLLLLDLLHSLTVTDSQLH